MPASEIDPVRLRIADVLDSCANQNGWNQELWEQFNGLLKQTKIDGLLAHAHEELTHYSGETEGRFFLGSPSASHVAELKENFRAIARALRSGTTWIEFKRQNDIYEGSDFYRATIARVKNLFR